MAFSRKEDYNRKSKKAFEKMKQVYGNEVNIPKSNIKLEEANFKSDSTSNKKSLIESDFKKSNRITLIVVILMCLSFCAIMFWLIKGN